MVHAANKEKYSSISRIAIAEREHPLKKLIDRLHIAPYIFLSREDDDDFRDIGKHDFRSVLPHPILCDANPFNFGCSDLLK